MKNRSFLVIGIGYFTASAIYAFMGNENKLDEIMFYSFVMFGFNAILGKLDELKKQIDMEIEFVEEQECGEGG